MIKISVFLEEIKLPKEIHRKSRSLHCLKFWKATEFRTFLLYLGPVILKHFLEPVIYEHFLLLLCGIVICSSQLYLKFLDIARQCFKLFIEQYIKLYGKDSISSNVHNLCHLVDEVEEFGILSTFSSYPFENALFQMKRLLRSGNKSLEQIAARIIERNCGITSTSNSENRLVYPVLRNKCNEHFDPDISDPRFKELYHIIELKKGLLLSKDCNDKWFLTNQNVVVGMQYAALHNGVTYIYGISLKDVKCLFETPIQSSHLNIFSSECLIYNISKFYITKDVKCKLVAVRYKHTTAFFPLLHTLG